jgi:DNA-directed RNA polymerase specialized sigma24 family protein
MSPEQLYKICLIRAKMFAHDDQSAEAAANGAAAHIWCLKKKPADAHKDERIWRFWARKYTGGSYRNEYTRRDQRLLVEETDIENDTSPSLHNMEPDDGYLDLMTESTAIRDIERIIEARETEKELLSLITETVTQGQGKILLYLAQGYSADEIAEILGTSRRYVYNAASRARERLRKANPDIPETYAEYLLHKAPKHDYRERHPSTRCETNLEWRLRKNTATLQGRAPRKGLC